LELEGEYENEINKLSQDRNDLQEQLNQVNYLLTKLKLEIAEKDNMIGRSVNDNDG
jgi:peptidoglycan hydrolase CwlO-like protein